MLVIISGLEVGKDTIIDALSGETHDPEYLYVVTPQYARHAGEVPGVDYHFLSRESSCASGQTASSSRPTRSTATGTARRATGPPGRVERTGCDPQDRRPGRPGGQGADARGAPDLRRPAVLEDMFASGRGQLSRPTSSSCASATRRSSWPAGTTYDYVVVNETGQVERMASLIDEIIADEHPAPGSASGYKRVIRNARWAVSIAHHGGRGVPGTWPAEAIDLPAWAARRGRGRCGGWAATRPFIPVPATRLADVAAGEAVLVEFGRAALGIILAEVGGPRGTTALGLSFRPGSSDGPLLPPLALDPRPVDIRPLPRPAGPRPRSILPPELLELDLVAEACRSRRGTS